MRILAFAAVIVGSFSTTSLWAADPLTLCCVCTGDTSDRSVTPTVDQSLIGGKSPCDVACESNLQGKNRWRKEDKTPFWFVPHDAQCGTSPPQPLAATFPNVRASAKYSVGHQGAVVWVGSSDQLLPVDQLRRSLAKTVMDSTALIKASDAVLIEGTMAGIVDCVNETEQDVRPGFLWACTNQKLSQPIHGAFDRGDYDSIRTLFSFAERDQDRFRNAIYCRNGSQIADLVRNACPVMAPIPEQRRHEGKGGDLLAFDGGSSFVDLTDGVRAMNVRFAGAGIILVVGVLLGFVAGRWWR